jgi:plastocyanin
MVRARDASGARRERPRPHQAEAMEVEMFSPPRGRVRIALLAMLAVAALAVPACSKKSSSPAAPGPVAEPFDSHVFSSADPVHEYVHTFPNEGDFAYHCSIHGTAMSGTVHVAIGENDSNSVVIANNTYTPASISVKPGGYIHWRNNAGGSHSVTRP